MAKPSQSADQPEGSLPLEGYLVEKLIIVASSLAQSHIFRKDPSIPFCQVCLISGLNGHPVAHLRSCAVGLVLSAVEQLRSAESDSRIDELRSAAEHLRIQFADAGETVGAELA